MERRATAGATSLETCTTPPSPTTHGRRSARGPGAVLRGRGRRPAVEDQAEQAARRHRGRDVREAERRTGHGRQPKGAADSVLDVLLVLGEPALDDAPEQ